MCARVCGGGYNAVFLMHYLFIYLFIYRQYKLHLKSAFQTMRNKYKNKQILQRRKLEALRC